MSVKVTIVGCGYTGRRLAQRWLTRGVPVRGFAARPQSLGPLRALGLQAACLDLDAAIAPIDCADQLLYYAVPPVATSAEPRVARLLRALHGLPSRFIYLSTTAVYGDHGGAVVDEMTPPAPSSERGRRRLADEQAVRAWAQPREASWCILRVAGIYGPGRLPLDRLQRKLPAIAPEEAGPGNRIHVDDLVSACMAAAGAAADRRIFNVADGCHASQTEYLQRLAALAGLPPPPLVSRADARHLLPEAAWSFLAESRRIDNARLRTDLGVTVRYADLDAGIRASLTLE